MQYLWQKQERLISAGAPALWLPSWQSRLAALNRTWHVVLFAPLSFSGPSGNLNTNALFQGNNLFLPLAILFAFHLLIVIVTFALFIVLGQWHQYFTITTENLLQTYEKKTKKNPREQSFHLMQWIFSPITAEVMKKLF